MKIFTCTGPVDLDEQVITADPNMCDNCKCLVINEMKERAPFFTFDKKTPPTESKEFDLQMLVMS